MKNSQARVSIIILGYNNKKYLQYCLESALNQSYNNLEIIYVDNDSNDGSLDFVFKNFGDKVEMVANKKNVGYAGGNNVGFRRSTGQFIMCMNPDVVIDQDYIKNIVEIFNKDENIGACTGKLLKYSLEKGKVIKKNIIDSLGLKIKRNHQILDIGSGTVDDKKQKISEVFGVSGAAPIFRRKALEDIKCGGQYFDEDLFMYKEDVDMSWRLKHRGWKMMLVPSSVGWHDRWESGTGKNRRDAVNYRKEKSRFTNRLSYRNHLIVNSKNEFASNLLLYGVFIKFYEFSKFIYLMMLETKTLQGLLEFVKFLPLTMKKRRDILRRSKIKPSDVRRWF